MTVNEVCNYFDLSEIVDTKLDIDREYYSATGNIYSDGDVKYHMTREAYIHITSVHDASYIIFADRDYNTCLCVYKYIPDITCKYILENLNLLKNTIKKSDIHHHDEDESKYIDSHVNDDVVDINTFTCTECESKDQMIFTRSVNNPEALEAKCNTCKTEYVFTPSKYYKLASKRIIYFKSEDSSRQIKINNNNKPVDKNKPKSKPPEKITKNKNYGLKQRDPIK